MIGSSVRLGRVFGIPLGLNYSWFIIFALITLSLAHTFGAWYPHWSLAERWGIALVTSLLFFASVVAHELSHSLVALRQGIPVKGITLFIFGGVSQISREASTPWKELAVAIVGPLSSFVLGFIFLGLYLAFGTFSEHLAAMAEVLFPINFLLGAFNMMPGFPLDGGRVLRSILWGITRNYRRSTRIAVLAGQVVALGLILIGVIVLLGGNMMQGLWLALIGWFLEMAATQTYRQFQLREALKGYVARDLMVAECPTVSPSQSLQQLVDEEIMARGHRCIVVSRDDEVCGIITLKGVKDVPREQWDTTSVGEAMIPLGEMKAVGPTADAYSVVELIDEGDVNQVPVLEEGRLLLGLVSRDSVLHFIRLRSELGV